MYTLLSDKGPSLETLSPGHTAHDNDDAKKYRSPFKCMLAGTLLRYVANMHLIGERYFLYRYRVQCDWAFRPPSCSIFRLYTNISISICSIY